MRTAKEIDYPTWLSTDQAARYVGITSRTLALLVEDGSLAAYRFGRVFRYRLEDVQAYVEGARWAPGKDER